MKTLSAVLLLVLGSCLVACAGVDDPNDTTHQDDEATGEAEQAIRDYMVLRTYYGEPAHTTIVGTRFYGCTGTTTHGHTSAYFEDENEGAC